mmetsp:Transcript_86/g.286  ORF Transcript_86/g.286 Transcript_86/m.286 type:complete len:307 (+) Transcript_86:3-923(+)
MIQASLPNPKRVLSAASPEDKPLLENFLWVLADLRHQGQCRCLDPAKHVLELVGLGLVAVGNARCHVIIVATPHCVVSHGEGDAAIVKWKRGQGVAREQPAGKAQAAHRGEGPNHLLRAWRCQHLLRNVWLAVRAADPHEKGWDPRPLDLQLHGLGALAFEGLHHLLISGVRLLATACTGAVHLCNPVPHLNSLLGVGGQGIVVALDSSGANSCDGDPADHVVLANLKAERLRAGASHLDGLSAGRAASALDQAGHGLALRGADVGVPTVLPLVLGDVAAVVESNYQRASGQKKHKEDGPPPWPEI